MNDRILELFKQANAEAYKMCKDHGRKVGEVDSIWVSIMAHTLAELVVKECANICLAQRDPSNLNYKPSERFAEEIKLHFGVK